ncbi:DNA-binding response regulator [Streptomyces dioscori]|uniref:DNA-binding response regulator n=1 Tax=Streptomyces dioscori TaxID=2109333 RepID=A0A2P8PTI3_9ACTN|nr:DNA-binding response regulator [Streptomyces dioscori]
MKVVLVDDHPLFRFGLRAALESSSDIAVVGEAADLDSAVAATLATAADVVLMDLELGTPGASGIEATRRLAAEAPTVAVLVLTMSKDDDHLLAAVRAGARGYLVKGAGREEVLHAVRTAAAGGAVFCAGVAPRVTQLLRGTGTARNPEVLPQLTAREREVLDHVARGKANHRIAQQLGLSEKTVRNHVSHILDKMQAASRAELVARARAAGLGEDVDD